MRRLSRLTRTNLRRLLNFSRAFGSRQLSMFPKSTGSCHLSLRLGRPRRSRLGRNKPFLVWGKGGAVSGFSPCERISVYEQNQTRLFLPFLPDRQAEAHPCPHFWLRALHVQLGAAPLDRHVP